jgi:hypothetical protein
MLEIFKFSLSRPVKFSQFKWLLVRSIFSPPFEKAVTLFQPLITPFRDTVGAEGGLFFLITFSEASNNNNERKSKTLMVQSEIIKLLNLRY